MTKPNLRDLLTAFGQAYHKLLSEGALHGPSVEATEQAITELFRSSTEPAGLDRHSPAQAAAFLRERARVNRDEYARQLPRPLEQWEINVLLHWAARFEQIAELIEHLARPAHEREGPHCPTCECPALEKAGFPLPDFEPKAKLICGKCVWHSESITALFCSHCGKPLPDNI